MELTKENLIEFLDEHKVVYADNTEHSLPPDGYELGDEVIWSGGREQFPAFFICLLKTKTVTP